jgi:GT2 family glycosyltransferase
MTAPMLLPFCAFLLALCFALLIGAWRNAVDGPAMEGQGKERPGLPVSCIVPARNEVHGIVGLLQDLHAQGLPPERMEVLVVDDGSTDATAAAVENMLPRWPALRLLHNPGQGKKAAMEHGVAHARHPLVLMTDADARCGPRRVAQVVHAFQESAVDLLLLPAVTACDGTWPGRVQADEQAAMLAAAIGSAAMGRPLLGFGANMAFRKDAFLAVGGFQGDDKASGDDLFLMQRMRRAGMQVRFLSDPATAVHVQPERGLTAWWRQRLRWAGKMGSIGGAASWGGAAALALPWFLLLATCRFHFNDALGQGALRSAGLLAAAWLLWALPAVALVRAVERKYAPEAAPPPGDRLFTWASLLAFTCYAPVIAVASRFARPLWKGRPT